ncbi:hypothetical protein SLEP1_g46331 [Rubroshorea leprosula]|uniref:C2 DOCK-type domain-containing protein n=1 Tax=Rubroshorea leprosula TaxID=152421 RepID=A0AAV5LMI5_9ROSI|nr:hypothetical protein SLEP1_g46331 [Rubroshorea leprosula]
MIQMQCIPGNLVYNFRVAVRASVACYHDEIKVSLPAVWTPLHHLLFTFFHVDLQMKLEAPKPVVIGYAALPLSTHAQYAIAFMFVIFCFVSFLDDLLTFIICSATGVRGMVVHGYFPGLCCGLRSEISLPIMRELVPQYLQENGKERLDYLEDGKTIFKLQLRLCSSFYPINEHIWDFFNKPSLGF